MLYKNLSICTYVSPAYCIQYYALNIRLPHTTHLHALTIEEMVRAATADEATADSLIAC